MSETPSASEVAASVHDATQAAFEQGASTGLAIADSAIDEANRRVDDAQEMAAQIAAAALESERGRRIEALEERLSNWQGVLENLQAQMQALSETMNRLATSQAAVVGMELQEAASSQSTPATLETLTETPIAEAAEIAEVLPQTLQNVAAENPVAETPPPRKARRLM